MDRLTEEQAEEIEAMESIYPGEWKKVHHAKYQMEFTLKFLRAPHPDIPKLRFTVELPPGYPADSPPIYDLFSPWVQKSAMNALSSDLQSIYLDNLGSPVLFLWAQRIEEFVAEQAQIHGDEEVALSTEAKEAAEQAESEQQLIEEALEMVSITEQPEKRPELPEVEVVHGEIVTDRKSHFQGHAAYVTSLAEVESVIAQLMENRKIATATHNIRAYRISCPERKAVLQDCDDDGETHAGSRLLHLLQMTKCMNVVVVVTRWYGGIHLGPDRFKHINNAARQVLGAGGFLENEASVLGATEKETGSRKSRPRQ